MEALTDELLGAILSELRQMHATLRRQTRSSEGRAALVDAVRDALGAARFTMRGLIELASDEPAVAEALAVLVDAGAPGAAITLNRLVKHWPEFEQVGEQRGSAVFRLRD